MIIDALHLQVLRTHQPYDQLLTRAANETGRSEADASAALRQYEAFGALPSWASEYFISANDEETA
jgi:hypothetical protein